VPKNPGELRPRAVATLLSYVVTEAAGRRRGARRE
jgi:hypothetical protein